MGEIKSSVHSEWGCQQRIAFAPSLEGKKITDK